MSNEFDKSKHVYELNITNFSNIKGGKVKVSHSELKDKKCGMILFYHHWCPHCQSMVPTWNKLGSKVKKDVFVGAVHGSNEASGNDLVFEQLHVQGVPDIRYLTEDHNVDNSMYEGPRSVEDIIKFIDSKDKSKSKSKSVKKSKSVSKKSKKKGGSKRKKIKRKKSITKKRIIGKNNKIKK